MKMRVNLGRIGFLLAASPWILLLIACVLRTPPVSFINNMAVTLIVGAPVALLFSIAGFVGDGFRPWAVAGTAIAFLNLLLGRLASS